MAAHDEVVIHIDKKDHRSPEHTTGTALYVLGSIDASQYDLFRELPGKGDDEQISNDSTPVTVKNGDHFFSSKKKLNPGSIVCR